MIDLSPRDLTTIKRILARLMPECEVRAFGSRIAGNARENSDLDLVVVGPDKVSRRTLSSLRHELEESSVPVTVDVLDWHRISPEFRKNIEKQYETIQNIHERTIPEGWTIRRISEIAEVIGGGTPKTDHEEYWGGDIPWITPKDLARDHPRFVRRGERNITRKGLENSSARLLPASSVLLTTRAPVGYVALAGTSVATNQGLRNLVLRDGYNPQFIYYLLRQNTEYLKQHASGSTFQEISGSTLKTLEFPIPTFVEQHAIADILGSLDDKIELNRRTNRVLEDMARAIFKAWFIDFLPVRWKAAQAGNQPSPTAPAPLPKVEGGNPAAHFGMPQEVFDQLPDRFTDSELGPVPEGWSHVPIGDMVKVVGGGTPRTKNPEFWEGGMNPFCTPKDMSKLDVPVILDTERKITAAGVDKISSGQLSVGTVILSSRAPIGYLALAATPLSVNQGIIAMQTGDIPNTYVLQWTGANMDRIKSQAGGSTFAEISKRNFRPIPALRPDDSTLSAFGEVGASIYDAITRNARESRVLAELRETLLPKLISGELRVSQAEKILEERIG